MAVEPKETLSFRGKTYLVRRRVNDGARSVVFLCSALSEDEAFFSEAITDALKVSYIAAENIASIKSEVAFQSAAQHPNIVRCWGSEFCRVGDGQGTFRATIRLEYCNGQSVARSLISASHAHHQLPLEVVLDVCLSVAAALSCLHAQSPPITHRDVKPENVLSHSQSCANASVYKLCDFGSATRKTFDMRRLSQGNCGVPSSAAFVKAVSVEVERHTTAAYRAPEMCDPWRGEPIDERSDVWALGVMAYYLLFQTFPFATTLSTLQLQYSMPSVPSAFSPAGRDVHGAIIELIRRCLTVRRHRPSIFELITFLESLEAPVLQQRLATLIFCVPPSVALSEGDDQKFLEDKVETSETAEHTEVIPAMETRLSVPSQRNRPVDVSRGVTHSSVNALEGPAKYDLFSVLEWHDHRVKSSETAEHKNASQRRESIGADETARATTVDGRKENESVAEDVTALNKAMNDLFGNFPVVGEKESLSQLKQEGTVDLFEDFWK